MQKSFAISILGLSCLVFALQATAEPAKAVKSKATNAQSKVAHKAPKKDGVAAEANVVRRHRSQLLSDPYRPTYHYVAPEGVNAPFDPNGGLYWKGRYHLMYIVQTEKGHSWAHVSSHDLLHWRHHLPALEPGEGDKGIFSGGAFLDKNGTPTLVYWGLGKERGIGLATSTDDNLDYWKKNPLNPVIRQTGFGLAEVPKQDKSGSVIYGVADPSGIWIYEGHYYLLTGNLLVLEKFGIKKKQPEYLGDRLYLFSSDDLVHWTYLHPFYESNRKWTAETEDDMCPDFFPLPSSPSGGAPSDRHMLLFISHTRGSQYYIGKYDGQKFTPEVHDRMSWVDNTFFAPETLIDGKGRRLMWAWLLDGRSLSEQRASRWSGELSLPRELWLGEDNLLRVRPAKELENLRYNETSSDETSTIQSDEEKVVPNMAGNTAELQLEMHSADAREYGIQVCRSPDGKEKTSIYYDAQEQKIKIDTSQASLIHKNGGVEAADLKIKPGEPLFVRIFIDRSVVEVFVNDRQALTRHIYPSRKESVGIALFSKGGSSEFRQLRIWQLSPSNPY